MIKKEDRLPKFKNCVHNWRFFKSLNGFEVFYCTKCLLYTLKSPDSLIPLKEYIKKHLKGGLKKK